MTDAERLAEAWMATVLDGDPNDLRAVCQRLIDSGVVTVNPPPDPAQQIAEAWVQAPGNGIDATRRLIADGYIVPGPACEGVEPDAVTAAEREVIAAAEDWADGEPGASERMHTAMRALREARA